MANPGPWTASPQNIAKIDGCPVRRIPISGGGQAIAAVWNGSVGKEFIGSNGDANACLIAAAPDLYAALKALKLECLADPLNPCWDNRPSDKPGLHWGSERGALIPACSSCNARAALAKAEAV